MYSHLAVNGKLISILSTLAPGVLNPKLVPRSFTRLNSTYRPLLSCCHSFCSGVNGIFFRLSMIGRYEGRNDSRQVVAKVSNSGAVATEESRSSKKMPPTPRDSLRWGRKKYLSHHALKRG